MTEPLRIGDPGTVTRCPECDVPMSGYVIDHDWREKYPRVEAWPGGPVIEATWELPEWESVASWFTAEPCGHVMSAVGLTLVTTKPPP